MNYSEPTTNQTIWKLVSFSLITIRLFLSISYMLEEAERSVSSELVVVFVLNVFNYDSELERRN